MSSAATDVVAALAPLVGDHSLAVIGAVARNAWDPPRATTDIDLAVAALADVVDRIQRALHRLGYEPVRSHRTDPSDPLADLIILRAPGGGLRQVDLLIAKTPFEVEVLRRAVSIEIAGVILPVATPEDLIVYKLLANRPRDRDDISAILRTQSRTSRPIDWEHVDRWARFWGISDRADELRR